LRLRVRINKSLKEKYLLHSSHVDYEVVYAGHKEQLSERTFISFPLIIPSAFFSPEIKVLAFGCNKAEKINFWQKQNFRLLTIMRKVNHRN
jgi:hypothetical protein